MTRPSFHAGAPRGQQIKRNHAEAPRPRTWRETSTGQRDGRRPQLERRSPSPQGTCPRFYLWWKSSMSKPTSISSKPPCPNGVWTSERVDQEAPAATSTAVGFLPPPLLASTQFCSSNNDQVLLFYSTATSIASSHGFVPVKLLIKS